MVRKEKKKLLSELSDHDYLTGNGAPGGGVALRHLQTCRWLFMDGFVKLDE
jgi:hypothetical protein